MKNKLPDDKQLLSKKEILNKSISNALNNKRKTLKVTIRDKLHLLNDELIRFKGSGISYKIIRKILKENMQLEVSEQTLREHCQQELGFTKRGAVNAGQLNAPEIKNEATIVSSTDKQLHSLNQGNTLNKHEILIKTQASDVLSSTIKAIPNTLVSSQITKQTTKLINQIEDY